MYRLQYRSAEKGSAILRLEFGVNHAFRCHSGEATAVRINVIAINDCRGATGKLARLSVLPALLRWPGDRVYRDSM